LANHGQLKPWQPGQSGNPKGRPKQDPDLISAKKLSRENVERAISKYMRWSYKDIKEMIASKSGTALELMIARIIEKTLSGGDHAPLNFLLDRLIGKVKDKVEVTKTEPVILKMSDGENIYMNSHTKLESEIEDEY
jgi:hypothetical protein